ncbi:hypothetical protein MKZ38_000040 [Zalerion maritima]|uniref:Uncharacterized protein n=1 Tax=Zalerion maritima TaxID=339359 RepID=A0AAD5RTB5_9PEZI|nr:hypothetical protein MKZ38_000040 [Zalerion maritima]
MRAQLVYDFTYRSHLDPAALEDLRHFAFAAAHGAHAAPHLAIPEESRSILGPRSAKLKFVIRAWHEIVCTVRMASLNREIGVSGGHLIRYGCSRAEAESGFVPGRKKQDVTVTQEKRRRAGRPPRDAVGVLSKKPVLPELGVDKSSPTPFQHSRPDDEA